MKNYLFSSILIIVISIISTACSSSNDSGECSSFLECLDGTYWTPNDNQSIWTFNDNQNGAYLEVYICLLYTSPSPRDRTRSRMPSSA